MMNFGIFPILFVVLLLLSSQVTPLILKYRDRFMKIREKINSQTPIYSQAKSKLTNPIPININTRFSNVYESVLYNRLFTFLPFTETFGSAYLAIAIPQNIILTIPDMCKP